jgi:hypothetical protein
LFERSHEGFFPFLFKFFVPIFKVWPATGLWPKQEVKRMLYLLKERG